MGKTNLSDQQINLLENMPGVTETIDKFIKEILGEDFEFALLVYNNNYGTLAGSRDPDETIDRLKRVIEAHDHVQACNANNENETKH